MSSFPLASARLESCEFRSKIIF